ncbi:hypothetical protein [Cyclobacterium xiamenense]|uniref:hypothetical protein n=1 Tax=Cyclobacterium xiamenense TaxID=1297121 RepID=UPI0012B97AB6|nr:hypothetical protein [Cyclobacterium xiamenense]
MDGIDTEYLTDCGFPSYNLALGGASLKTNIIQLSEYLSMYEYKPKIVLLGLGSYLNDFDSEEINPIVDFTMMKKKTYSLEDIPIFKFKWLFKEQLKKIVSKPHRDAYIKSGQLRFSKSVPDNTSISKGKIFPIGQYRSSQSLKAIIDICNSNKIKLIILEMPGFRNTRHEKINPCYVIDEESGNGFIYDFNYYDFGSLFVDDEDWIGNSHLNEKGAIKFTKYILDVLNEPCTIAQLCY